MVVTDFRISVSPVYVDYGCICKFLWGSLFPSHILSVSLHQIHVISVFGSICQDKYLNFWISGLGIYRHGSLRLELPATGGMLQSKLLCTIHPFLQNIDCEY